MESNPSSKSARGNERQWAPRMWIGCDFFAWLRIMYQGGFRFSLPHAHIGVCASAITFSNSVLKCVQNALYRKQIAATKIEKAPIFILGHWRTGTTLLHELMILDEQHNFPNTYQCLSPTDFLLTEKLFKKLFRLILPERRPMDNMRMGWDLPQEDEFALCMLGQPSPYLDIAFPNGPSIAPGSLDLSGLTPRQLREWKKTFHHFLQMLTFKDSRRLVLKSPPHTCRIETLLKMFPDARFVHIVRNPYDVFPSTVKLWKALADKHGLQIPKHQGIEEQVLRTLPQLYAKLEEGKKKVAPSRFHELRYEDLVQDPMGQMETLYKKLELRGFKRLKPNLATYLQNNSNYETNRFAISDEQRRQISERWGDVMRHYGYPVDSDRELPMPVALEQEAEDSRSILPFPASAADTGFISSRNRKMSSASRVS